jgi:hypothetical protein
MLRIKGALKMKLNKISVSLALALSLTFALQAKATPKEIKSCYELVNVPIESHPVQQRELIVVIDQTVEFSKDIQEDVFKKVLAFLQPGDNLKLLSFSAYVQGQVSQITLTGQMDTRLSNDQRYDIPKKTLKTLDKCYALQTQGLRQTFGKELIKVFAGSSSNIPNTELIDNLNTLSETLYSKDTSVKRYMLVVSDMMEHSSLTSFYQSGMLKNFSPEKELAKIEQAGIKMDFKKAHVFVVGAGYTKKGTYRSGQSMRNFKSFWESFFAKQNAELKAFGTPMLMNDIQ